jgi:phosphatidylserine/phosphatidylglycerophosphate/cardiolipin synthase-like enzyme
MISLLYQRSHEGVETTIFYDPSASSSDLKPLLHHCAIHPVYGKGLMHRKILIIDEEVLFLGSANLTTQSLKLHDNFVIGLHHPPLAHFLAQNLSEENPFRFDLPSQQGELWLLPDPSGSALPRLLQLIAEAKQSIHIAMFTFTHPQIIQALIESAQKGVEVQLSLDYFTARGASKKAIEQLQLHNIPVHLSSGKQLLHHKWALLDGKTLIVGSANWTKAAFERNCDFILTLTPLTDKQRQYIDNIWDFLLLEAFD